MINVQFVSYWNRSQNGHPPNSRESRIANQEMRISLAKRFQVFVRKLGQRQASQSCENEIPWLATNSQFQLLPSLEMKTHQRRTGAEFKTILIWLKNVIRSTWRKQQSPSFFVVSGFGVDSSCLIHMPSSFMSREFLWSNHPTEIGFWKAGIVGSWQIGRSTNDRVVLFSRNDF